MGQIFARHLHHAMHAAGLNRRELVARLYRNGNKGRRRVDAWLAGEAVPAPAQLRQLTQLFGLPEDQLPRTLEWDAVRARADAAQARLQKCRERAQDPRYQLVIRYIPGFYQSTWLEAPHEEAAIEHARELAQSHPRPTDRWAVCLETPACSIYYFDSEGELIRVLRSSEPPETTVDGRPTLWW